MERRAGAGGFIGASSRELRLLAGAVALGVLVRLGYAAAVAGNAPVGDAAEYHAMGVLADGGRWFWGLTPYGEPHPTMWKAPGYPAWVGAWYEVLGPSPARVGAVQALLALVTIPLTWALGRRLFGAGVGLGAAAVVAVHPAAWQYDGLLYSEALALPLFVAALLVVLDRPATIRRALALGALLGLGLLVRPPAIILLAGAAAAWIVAAGWARGLGLTALAAVVAALVVSPWTLRNHRISGEVVPLSVQDAAVSGTFNPTSASDRVWPFKWRPVPERDRDLLGAEAERLPEAELRARLHERARAFVAGRPWAVAESFWWNGITRLWDLRSPARAIDEAPFEGRPRAVAAAALGAHWALLPFALLGLWGARRRRAVLLPLLAVALAASTVHTVEGGTRYRTPLTPLIAILGCAGLAGLAFKRSWTFPGGAAARQVPAKLQRQHGHDPQPQQRAGNHVEQDQGPGARQDEQDGRHDGQ